MTKLYAEFRQAILNRLGIVSSIFEEHLKAIIVVDTNTSTILLKTEREVDIFVSGFNIGKEIAEQN